MGFRGWMDACNTITCVYICMSVGIHDDVQLCNSKRVIDHDSGWSSFSQAVGFKAGHGKECT